MGGVLKVWEGKAFLKSHFCKNFNPESHFRKSLPPPNAFTKRGDPPTERKRKQFHTLEKGPGQKK